jgi:hypothetical protein
MDTKTKGSIAVGAVMSRLLKSGRVLLLPVGDNERYDLVVEDDEEFKRVQVKVGRVKNGAVHFDTSSTNYVKGKWKRTKYTGQVEFFGVHCPEIDKTYLISAEEIDKLYGACLRLEDAKNKQTKGVRFAKDYEI